MPGPGVLRQPSVLHRDVRDLPPSHLLPGHHAPAPALGGVIRGHQRAQVVQVIGLHPVHALGDAAHDLHLVLRPRAVISPGALRAGAPHAQLLVGGVQDLRGLRVLVVGDPGGVRGGTGQIPGDAALGVTEPEEQLLGRGVVRVDDGLAHQILLVVPQPAALLLGLAQHGQGDGDLHDAGLVAPRVRVVGVGAAGGDVVGGEAQLRAVVPAADLVQGGGHGVRGVILRGFGGVGHGTLGGLPLGRGRPAGTQGETEHGD